MDGQITSAAFSGDSILLLIGYKPPAYSPFAFLAWNYQQTDLFSGNKRRLQLGTVLTMGQQEGVCFSSGKKGFISSEQVTALNQVSRYFSFDLSSLIVSTVGLNEQFSPSWSIYPNPFQETFFIEGLKLDELGELRFVNALGVEIPVNMKQANETTIELNTDQLFKGCYFLSFIQNEKLMYIKVIKE